MSRGEPRHRERSLVKLAAICTIPPVTATTLVGVALGHFASLGFFVLYGVVIGALAMGFGLLVGRITQPSGDERSKHR